MAPAGTAAASGSTSSDQKLSKKRKSPATEPDAIPQDNRFKFTAHDLEEEEDHAVNEGLSGGTFPKQTTLPAHLLPKSASSNQPTPGLVYLSRIPPGMGPSKVKHLLGAYGEVGRVYLARDDPNPPAPLSAKKRQKEKHREHKFKEGWVEFLDKRVARSVAEMLNANTIGGKKGSRWRDDVWTMKYLPRFRWDQLSEQVALERATQTSLLRFHLQHSKAEQESYLSAVEKARVGKKIEEKAAGRKKARVDSGTDASVAGTTEEKPEGKEKKTGRTYRQREPLKAGGSGAEGDDDAGRRPGTKKDLDNVLNRLF